MDSSTIEITVLPNTLVASITALSDTTFCYGDSTILTSEVTGGYPAFDYLWSTIETDTAIVAAYTGSYYLEANDNKGCYSRSSNINVLVNPVPVPKITGKNQVCLYSQEIYTVDYPAGLYTIEWSLNGTVQWATENKYYFYGNTVGNNTLVVMVMSPDSCVGYDTIKIEVVPNPNVSIASSGVLCEGETHLLVGSSTNTNIISSYWNNGDVNNSIYASNPGGYTFTVVDSLGCESNATETIHPLPEFCGLLTGCYEICDTITELVWFAPKGYAAYQWLYNGVNISGSIYDTLHVPLYQSGMYQVIIATATGCKDTSDIIDIQFTPCQPAGCGISATDSITCGPIDEHGNQTYSILFDINNTFGAGSIVNIYSLQGSITGITPSVIPLGNTTVSATFTDIGLIDTLVCFNITLTYNNERCGIEICSELPDCSRTCELDTYGICAHCKEETELGWTYDIELTIQNDFAGNAALSVLPISAGSFGSITPSIIPPGLTTTTISFTDTNPQDSIICFRILLDYEGRICESDVCVYLPDCRKTGVSSIYKERSIFIFPNPATNKISLRYTLPNAIESTISIKDLQGRVISTQQIYDSENIIQINVDNYKTGLYIVEIKNQDFIESVQLIISD
jgi:hypothetical protein